MYSPSFYELFFGEFQGVADVFVI